MESQGYVVVLVTAPTGEEAQELARVLLDGKKAACVSISHGIVSAFFWENKVEVGPESLLIIKTKAALLDEVIDLVKSVHSYKVPEIIALPVVGGNPDYLKWMDESLSG